MFLSSPKKKIYPKIELNSQGQTVFFFWHTVVLYIDVFILISTVFVAIRAESFCNERYRENLGVYSKNNSGPEAWSGAEVWTKLRKHCMGFIYQDLNAQINKKTHTTANLIN